MVHFAPDYLDLKKAQYVAGKQFILMKNKKQNSKKLHVCTLPSTKMGQPLKLGTELDNHIC